MISLKDKCPVTMIILISMTGVKNKIKLKAKHTDANAQLRFIDLHKMALAPYADLPEIIKNKTI